MRRIAASCSLILLAACSQPWPAPTPVAVKGWPRDEQVEIAKERNALADSNLTCSDRSGKPLVFTLAPAVFDDWERMRRELRK